MISHETDGARARARAVSGGQAGDHGVNIIGRGGGELWSDGWLESHYSQTPDWRFRDNNYII